MYPVLQRHKIDLKLEYLKFTNEELSNEAQLVYTEQLELPNLKEYPTMHYFGFPIHSVDKSMWFSLNNSKESQFEIALWDCRQYIYSDSVPCESC